MEVINFGREKEAIEGGNFPLDYQETKEYFFAASY